MTPTIERNLKMARYHDQENAEETKTGEILIRDENQQIVNIITSHNLKNKKDRKRAMRPTSTKINKLKSRTGTKKSTLGLLRLKIAKQRLQ